MHRHRSPFEVQVADDRTFEKVKGEGAVPFNIF